jgi:hypothetical protein
MSIEWNKTEQGYASRFYRIRRMREIARWRLEPASFRIPASRRTPCPSVHESLRDAFMEAAALERERREDLRVRTYLVLAAAAAVVCVLAMSAIRSIPTYLVTTVSGTVALRLFADAVANRYSDAWGWAQDDGTTRIDSPFTRLVDRLATWAQGAPEWPVALPGSPVRVVSPFGDPPGDRQ